MNKMNSRNLIEALIAGNAIDRLPVAFWRHFPIDDQHPDRLAAATIHFQDTYNMDIIKVSPSSSFCLKDWGIKDAWVGNTEGTRDYAPESLLQPSDLGNLPILDPKNGSLGIQLKALAQLSEYYYSTTPIVQTIFNPLAQLKNILGKQNLISAIRSDPKSIIKGLETITESTILFMKACLELKIDGFFYAIQHASSDVLSRTEFIEFGKKYDERIFPLLNMHGIDIMHVHGENIFFDLVQDYPLSIINWHDRETNPNLETASSASLKVLCGGLSRITTMVRGNEKIIKTQIDDAIKQTKMKNFILGTGCVLPIITPHGNIQHAINYARSIS